MGHVWARCHGEALVVDELAGITSIAKPLPFATVDIAVRVGPQGGWWCRCTMQIARHTVRVIMQAQQMS